MQQLNIVCSVFTTRLCNLHQSVNKEIQSLMQIRECDVVPNWVKQLVHEFKVVKMVQFFLLFLC